MDVTRRPTYREARDTLLALRDQRDRAVAGFVWPAVGDRFNWAHDWFDPIARGNGKPALVIADESGGRVTYSFEEMARRSDQLARWLLARGVVSGDPILIMLGNQVELWDAMLAAIKIGAVIVPTTTALGPDDLADRVDRAAVRAVLCNVADCWKFDGIADEVIRLRVGGSQREGWADLSDARHEASIPVDHPARATTDPLLLYFTSGTTSKPKLVEHTNESYPVGHLTTMYWLGLRPGDVHLNISTSGWAKHAWSCFFAPWIAEATIFIHSVARFDAQSLLDLLHSANVTSICAPPTVWRMLINADLSSGSGALRELAAAGEPLNPEVIDKVRDAWGLTIRDGFGQTETTALIGNPPGSQVRPGSMGRPLPGAPVVLVDPATSEELKDPGEGEICLDRSRHALPLMTGYRNTAGGADGGDRYYRTGDIAKIDEAGYITYVGRSDDVFKASDYKISPFELESVLIEHDAVAEAAVVPFPDPVRLAVPKAYVTLAPGHEASGEIAESVLAHARRRLAPHQRVRRIEFLDDLPKTISGKIRRAELRTRAAAIPDGNSSSIREWRDDEFPQLPRS